MSYLSLIVLLRELLKKEIIYKGTLYYRLLRDFPGFLAQLLRLVQQPGSSRPLNSGKLWGPQQERFAFAFPYNALHLRPGERSAEAASRQRKRGKSERMIFHLAFVLGQLKISPILENLEFRTVPHLP